MPSKDIPKDELPERTPKSALEQGVLTNEKILSDEEHFDTLSDLRKNPVDLTVDSESDWEKDRLAREKIIGYDPIIHANVKAPNVELDAATWDDLRALPAPPPTPSGNHKVYVCIQHPSMICFAPDGRTVVAQFKDGYFATDDSRVQKVLEHPSQKYIKRLDMKVH